LFKLKLHVEYVEDVEHLIVRQRDGVRVTGKIVGDRHLHVKIFSVENFSTHRTSILPFLFPFFQAVRMKPVTASNLWRIASDSDLVQAN